MMELLLILSFLFISNYSIAQKTWIDKDTVKTCYSCSQHEVVTIDANATLSYSNGRSARLPYSDHLSLPTKYHKYRIHVVNNCHWILASKTKWIAGLRSSYWPIHSIF